ncbi:IS3 family transposase [Pontibacter sp. 13R65]|uniref:IS3 family transposase n=1 Tax=Pontibacter sp. 13R65 TaxID=3127458 RepID=UPI00301DA045
MKKTRFTESQIIKAFKEHEGGRKAEDICRELNVSRATFYRWKSQYGGMEASEVKRLKELEEENARLKKMFADLSLNHEILKEVITKKGLGPWQQRQLTEEIISDYGLSVARACRLTGLARSQFYYRSRKDDAEVIAALQELAAAHPTYGFRKLLAYLRRAGKAWNHKRVYRVYKLLQLNKKRRGRRRLPARVKQPLVKQAELNLSWSMDFMSDSLASGNRFRTLNVIDDCNREALAIEVATSISSKRVIRTLEQLIDWRGRPAAIRVDNGPEFTSADFTSWCREKEIGLHYTQPGKPMQNGYIERLNGSYRRDILDAYLFLELEEVRELTEQWMEEYNTRRPHEALGNLTPSEWPLKSSSGNMENCSPDTRPAQQVYHITTS